MSASVNTVAAAASASGGIDWIAFFSVLLWAMTAAIIVVGLYSLGLRMLIRGGRVPVVAPAEFTDAITVMTPAEARKAEKKAIKAAKKNPLTEGQKRFSRAIAYLCFALCAGAVLAGIYLIVPALHGG